LNRILYAFDVHLFVEKDIRRKQKPPET